MRIKIQRKSPSHYSFQCIFAGDKASADKVNENSETLIDAINDVIGFYQVVTLTSPTGVYPYGQSPRIGGVKVVRALSITGITDITVSDSGECNTYLQKP